MSYLDTKNKTLFAHGALVDRIKLECGYIGPSEVLCTMTGIFVRQRFRDRSGYTRKVEILMIKL